MKTKDSKIEEKMGIENMELRDDEMLVLKGGRKSPGGVDAGNNCNCNCGGSTEAGDGNHCNCGCEN